MSWTREQMAARAAAELIRRAVLEVLVRVRDLDDADVGGAGLDHGGRLILPPGSERNDWRGRRQEQSPSRQSGRPVVGPGSHKITGAFMISAHSVLKDLGGLRAVVPSCRRAARSATRFSKVEQTSGILIAEPLEIAD